MYTLIAILALGQLPPPTPLPPEPPPPPAKKVVPPELVKKAVIEDRALLMKAMNTDLQLNLLLRRLDEQEAIIEDYVGKGFRSDYVSLKLARNKATILKKKIACRKREIREEYGY